MKNQSPGLKTWSEIAVDDFLSAMPFPAALLDPEGTVVRWNRADGCRDGDAAERRGSQRDESPISELLGARWTSTREETCKAVSVSRVPAVFVDEYPSDLFHARMRCFRACIPLGAGGSDGTHLLSLLLGCASVSLDLTQRERSVLQLMGRGLSTHRIARALEISGKTVASHRNSIKRKMGFASNLELLTAAFRWAQEPEAGPFDVGSHRTRFADDLLEQIRITAMALRSLIPTPDALEGCRPDDRMLMRDALEGLIASIERFLSEAA